MSMGKSTRQRNVKVLRIEPLTRRSRHPLIQRNRLLIWLPGNHGSSASMSSRWLTLRTRWYLSGSSPTSSDTALLFWLPAIGIPMTCTKMVYSASTSCRSLTCSSCVVRSHGWTLWTIDASPNRVIPIILWKVERMPRAVWQICSKFCAPKRTTLLDLALSHISGGT